ncbi:MAG: AI-2E family transporter, partial [Opitutales bacterium]
MSEDPIPASDQTDSCPDISPETTPAVNAYSAMEQRAFLLLLALVSVLFLGLLKPFFSALFWACAVSIMFYPLYRRFLRLWGRPNLSALSTLGICVFVGVLPFFFILYSVLQEGTLIYQRVQSGEIDPSSYIERVRQGFPAVQHLLERLHIDLSTVKEHLSSLAVESSRFVAQNAVKIGQNVLQLIVAVGVMLYVTFYLLRDGPKLRAVLIRALPLGDAREHRLLDKFAEVTRATVKGNLMVAVIQGALGGLIFWILGIPGALLWGVVMALLSLIPMVGAGLVWVPVC